MVCPCSLGLLSCTFLHLKSHTVLQNVLTGSFSLNTEFTIMMIDIEMSTPHFLICHFDVSLTHGPLMFHYLHQTESLHDEVETSSTASVIYSPTKRTGFTHHAIGFNVSWLKNFIVSYGKS
ncbi:hypothetical protein BRADI_1g73123v3 [Brachypodium distachyon]|uniref:Uncharacterized protein n=1 Tax=Brachypodium distachyon TaxID=15368 RepID=A0A0Q3KG62_BRADI|nr:hypothetical protein BRADI_1g73123v3 [Brachypodium distachyon]